MKKQQKNKKNKKQEQPKKESKLLATINKFMPYVLAVLFTIVIFALILPGITGKTGNFIKSFLYGTFSNFSTALIAILLLYHAIMWYYDIKRKICARRVFCSLIAIVGISTLQHLIQMASDSTGLLGATTTELWDKANHVPSIGGGVVGGLVGNALYGCFANIGGVVLPIIIVLFVLTFMFLQMFNITPASMVRAAKKSKSKEKDELPKGKSTKKQKPQRVKHKKIDIFDDEDDYLDEESIAALELTDTSLTAINDDEEEEEYQNADEIMSSVRPIESSSQLKPYDSSFDYTKDYEEEKKEEFTFTSKPVVEYEEEEDDAPVMELSAQHEEKTTFVPYEAFDEDDDDSQFVEDDDDITPIAYSEPEEEIEEKEEESSWEKEEPYRPYETTITEEDSYVEDEDEEEVAPIIEEKKDDLDSYVAKGVLDKAILTKEEKAVESKPVFAPPPMERKPEPKPEPPKPKKKIKYVFPPIDFLKYNASNDDEEAVREELQENARIIVDTLNNFGVKTKIVDIARGPTVTRYEIAPEAGVRVKSIANLVDDIALNLAAEGIRIECPIPGKSAVGIEVPNRITSIVYLKELIAHKKFKEAKSVLTVALGKSISGDVEYADIEKTPHLLVAGATSMGKSVCINSMLISLLYKSRPDEVRLILIDPKRVEFSDFNGLPHLLVPVVTEPKKSLGALQWSVSEMERRFEIFEGVGARNLGEYNDKIDNGLEGEKMARIVIVIDELADLKMTVPDIEGYITRLTQKARAAGIHIIIGTQRPSVDVITGLIKSNIPSRISFRVASQVDSRTVLDEVGAEKLVYRGDMLVKIVGTLRPVRLQGSLVTASEVQDVISFIKENSSENYDESVMQQIDNNAAKLAKAEKKDMDDDEGGSSGSDEFDDKFYSALRLAVEMGKISSSLLMRKLGLGFQRASRIIDQMEECGYIGESNGSKPRDVLMSKQDFDEMMMRRDENYD